MLGMCLAAIAHDVDHPGLSNEFEIASESALARLHNNRSVLENHHAYMIGEFMRKPNNALVNNTILKRSDLVELRKITAEAILSTDMKVHFDFCKKLDTLDKPRLFSETTTPTGGRTPISSRDGSIPIPATKESSVHIQFVINLIVHAGDLSAQCYPTKEAERWAELVMSEMMREANASKDLGLAVLPHMQNLDDDDTRYRGQLGFMDFVLTPFWKSVVSKLPALTPCFVNLNKNKEGYKKLLWATVCNSLEKK